MATLDLLGSFIVGGLLLVAILGFMFYVMNSSQMTQLSEVKQTTATEFGRVIVHDFNKIGYRVLSGNKITEITSSSIGFRADINNDGAIDSVRYYLQQTGHGNKLIRHTSYTQNQNVGLDVAGFTVTAFDTLGNQTTNIALARVLQIDLLLQEQFQRKEIDESIGTFWSRRFRPKNL